jgi:drug/metabolite transporter (DMT)-like permease
MVSYGAIIPASVGEANIISHPLPLEPSKLKTKIFPVLEAIFAVIVWGASFIATKVALRDVNPVTVVWLRFALGVLILGIAVAARRQFALPARNEWGYFALLGFLGITFHQWLQSNGLLTATAITTAWIVSTTPIFMALLGLLMLKEGLGWLRAAGIILATAGMLLVVSRGNLASLARAGFGAPGDYLILISAVNWAVFSTLSRRGLKTHPAARMMFYVMTFGWLFTTILFFGTSRLDEIARLTLPGWTGVAFLGIFCSGLAYIAWYDALQALPAAQVGAFLYVEPLVTMVTAAIILGEKITPAALAGGAIILVGLWLVNRPGKADGDV